MFENKEAMGRKNQRGMGIKSKDREVIKAWTMMKTIRRVLLRKAEENQYNRDQWKGNK